MKRLDKRQRFAARPTHLERQIGGSVYSDLSKTSLHPTMASIRSRHTKPELRVRRALWAKGVRYRLHAGELPGRPDVVIRSRKLAVFVHGCLWHLHEGCKLVRVPKSRPEYWPAKLAKNKARDKRHADELKKLGWSVEVIWECETADPERLQARVAQLLAAIRCATP